MTSNMSLNRQLKLLPLRRERHPFAGRVNAQSTRCGREISEVRPRLSFPPQPSGRLESDLVSYKQYVVALFFSAFASLFLSLKFLISKLTVLYSLIDLVIRRLLCDRYKGKEKICKSHHLGALKPYKQKLQMNRGCNLASPDPLSVEGEDRQTSQGCTWESFRLPGRELWKDIIGEAVTCVFCDRARQILKRVDKL